MPPGLTVPRGGGTVWITWFREAGVSPELNQAPGPTSKGRNLTQATQTPTRPAPKMPDLVWVTPAVARSYLDGNKRNRKLREARAQAFARDMMNGDWDEKVVAGLHFVNEDGLLGDGQHRLRAVEIAGETTNDPNFGVWFFVQSVPLMAIAKAVDRNVKRGITDSAHFAGIAANPVQLSVARKLLQLYAGYAPGSGGTYRPSDGEILDLLQTPMGAQIATAERVASLIRREGGLAARASVIGIAYLQAALVDQDGAEEFFVKQLAQSEGLVRTSPALALRRRMKNADKGMSDTEQYNYILHAWRHYREGNKLERLIPPKSWGPNGFAIAV